MEPTFKVDERRVVAALDRVPARLQRNLRPVMDRWAKSALSFVRSAEPFGREDRRRNVPHLRDETLSFVDVGPDYVRARVRILNENGAHNIRAAALEYGSHRRISVSAHSMALDHFWNLPDYAVVSVPTYQRMTNITALHMLLDAMAATKAQVRADIEATVSATVKTLD